MVRDSLLVREQGRFLRSKNHWGLSVFAAFTPPRATAAPNKGLLVIPAKAAAPLFFNEKA